MFFSPSHGKVLFHQFCQVVIKHFFLYSRVMRHIVMEICNADICYRTQLQKYEQRYWAGVYLALFWLILSYSRFFKRHGSCCISLYFDTISIDRHDRLEHLKKDFTEQVLGSCSVLKSWRTTSQRLFKLLQGRESCSSAQHFDKYSI